MGALATRPGPCYQVWPLLPGLALATRTGPCYQAWPLLPGLALARSATPSSLARFVTSYRCRFAPMATCAPCVRDLVPLITQLTERLREGTEKRRPVHSPGATTNNQLRRTDSPDI